LKLNRFPLLAGQETGDGRPRDGEQLTPKCQICLTPKAVWRGRECAAACISLCDECVDSVPQWISGVGEMAMDDGAARHQIDERLRCPVCRTVVSRFVRVEQEE
jgi:hypothetical protein